MFYKKNSGYYPLVFIIIILFGALTGTEVDTVLYQILFSAILFKRVCTPMSSHARGI